MADLIKVGIENEEAVDVIAFALRLRWKRWRNAILTGEAATFSVMA
jgi:hypothetical protein